MSDDNKDDFLVGSPSKFDWGRQPSSSNTSRASSPTTAQTQIDAVNCHPQEAASLHQCAKMISTMANLIQTSNAYADTIAKKSEDAAEEVKKEVTMLAETVRRVEERLSALEDGNQKKDSTDTVQDSSQEEVLKDALQHVNNRIDVKAVCYKSLEARVGGIERSIRYIEQMLVKCYKRRKVHKATAGRSG